MREHPWTTPFLLLALGVAFAGIFSRVQPMVFGDSDARSLAAFSGALAGLRSSGNGADIGSLYAGGARRMVPRGSAVDRVMRMTLDFFGEPMMQLPSNLPCNRTKVGALRWHQAAAMLHAAGGAVLRFGGLTIATATAAFASMLPISLKEGVVVFEHEMEPGAKPTIQALRKYFRVHCIWSARSTICLELSSMEPDQRGWLRHGGWPQTAFPLRRDFNGSSQFSIDSQPLCICPGRRGWRP